ncbi:MAG: zinc-finger domain-containing protein [Proteobacteria bacterium]|nr:zinc-finger domain-containing protein [Pseudomonadota bacterium]MDE2411359.1 zinc-finger domain-containing protein [Sphingomonadales bacterium]
MSTPVPTPEIVHVHTLRVSCDGASEIRGGAALGHPRVWMEIDERGYVDCGYCDKRFILDGTAPDSETGKPGH